jgi:hypothetical protein
MPTARDPAKTKTGSSRFMAGPAKTIKSFCQVGLAPSVSSTAASASGESSSPGFSPSIFTNPPSGNQATTYSVPPRSQRMRKRPKPTGDPNPRENLRTRTPQSLAAMK